MAEATAWNVLGHGPLVKLAENLWWVQGDLPGMSLKRCMTVARLDDRRLVIHNGIALSESAMQELLAWGTPAFLIVPSAYHRLDAPAYKARFPEIKVLTPKGARAKVSERVVVDGTYEDFPTDARIRFQTLHGTKDREGAMLVTSNDGVSVVLNDVVMNMDKKQDLLGYLFTTALGSAPGPRISRLSKLAIVGDHRTLRQELEVFAALPNLARVIVAHEKVTSGAEAAACLVGAMTFLKA